MNRNILAAVLFIWFSLFFSSAGFSEAINYIPLGDSYTIGEGVGFEETWPVLLVSHLQLKGVDIKLLINPARSGWTTQNVIDYQLPIFEKLKPNFATLLIGVNDWVQGVSPQVFQDRLGFLLDRMLKILPQKNRLVVITLPDFSATPKGILFGHGRDVSAGISQFNGIIKKEAAKHKLPVVDICPTSQKMKENVSLVASDGLHPSAKEYILWEELIFPVAYRMLSDNHMKK